MYDMCILSTLKLQNTFFSNRLATPNEYGNGPGGLNPPRSDCRTSPTAGLARFFSSKV